ncbi:MAG: TIM barrel protein [Chloroflexota bacterium]|nr:TIM barrel protein [Chloroflexota bacterium]
MTANTWPVAGAPVSFGVDEIMTDDAWMPGPVQLLDWMVEIGYEGTELGPPGYLGNADELHERLSTRGLQLVGAFLPQHFSRDERTAEDRAWLRDTLALIRAGAPEGSRPFAILSDGFDEPERLAFSGRIRDHPETWLSPARFESLVANLHRAAELCRNAGFDVLLHPHCGTYLETADEIARVAERIDPSLLGLVLDTGHFQWGGADPVRAVTDYRELVRHVHIKDCATRVIAEGGAAGDGLKEILTRGAFSPFGQGDVDIPGVLEALRGIGYEGWLVIEQDQALGPKDTPESVLAGQQFNRQFLRDLGV